MAYSPVASQHPAPLQQPASSVAHSGHPDDSPSGRLLHVAIIGNPNTGKSTLFNALSGLNARTGNYPGVTVEKKTGRLIWKNQPIELIDLPGTYSLSPRSLDEMVTVDILLGRQAAQQHIDAIICVADAGNLERNLYLLGQILELNLPTILALNMWDSAQASGLCIDVSRLSEKLGIPVVPCEAHKRRGISDLKNAILNTVGQTPEHRHRPLPETFYEILQGFAQQLNQNRDTPYPVYLIERLLLDQDGEVQKRLLAENPQTLPALLNQTRQHLRDKGFSLPGTEASSRYLWSSELIRQTVKSSEKHKASWTERLDHFALHPYLGPVFFSFIMLVIFQSIYNWAEPLIGFMELGQGTIADLVSSSLTPGPLRSLLVDGIIAGVGGVLVFLPQIALLFLFIALLEDSGYMARAAFMMDRLMAGLGLNGKSFLPLMSSFACAVPGIMATRTIDNHRDRLVTILIAPLMSCSARLPVYLLIIGTLIPDHHLVGNWISLRGVVLLLMNSIGMIIAIPIAILLKKFLVSSDPAPFLLELPRYQMPSFRVVFSRVYERSLAFVKRAGTLIFATTILIWAVSSYPGDHTQRYAIESKIEQLQASEQTPAISAELESLQAEFNLLSSDLLENSLIGQMGHAIAPIVRPLGWDWRIGIGALASFPAREVIIATLGIIYSLGGEVDESSEGLVSAIRTSTFPDGTPVYTIPTGLSLMVFFALCAQCVSTLITIRRETNSWRWPIFSFVYMTLLAYCAAWIVYQVMSRLL